MTKDTSARVVRTIVQLIAGGGLTGVVMELTNELNPSMTAMVMALSVLLVTFCQNYAEDAGWIPRMMKAAPAKPIADEQPAEAYVDWPEAGA